EAKAISRPSGDQLADAPRPSGRRPVPSAATTSSVPSVLGKGFASASNATSDPSGESCGSAASTSSGVSRRGWPPLELVSSSVPNGPQPPSPPLTKTSFEPSSENDGSMFSVARPHGTPATTDPAGKRTRNARIG